MKKTSKDSILNTYISLATKLGKFPSVKECTTFGIPSYMITNNFSNHNKLKEAALVQHPALSKLIMAPKLVTSQDIEAYRLGLEKSSNNKANKSLIADVSTLEQIALFAEGVFKGRIASNGKSKPKKKMSRTHTLLLSDLHLGGDLKADETGSEDFGTVEESRRLAGVFKAAGEYKADHRKDTKLVVVLGGDLIENQLHDARTGAVISEQVCRAIHLLSQGIGYLANLYASVEVKSTTGNHGRVTSRHKTRAVHQKFDSFETIIAFALKTACSNLKNVSFDIPKTPIGSYDVYGKKIAYLHGDTVFNPGNPGSSVNIKSLETQVNKLNAGLKDKDEYSVILYGHLHTHSVVFLSNGCVLIGNGALTPVDDFAVSIGIPENRNAGQVIFESTPDFVVGDIRFIRVGESYDKDSSLDKILKPWKSF